MSSKSSNHDHEADPQDGPTDADSATEPDDDGALTDASPLTIELPDGSSSVSEAILAHREMLRAPSEHGLATDEDVTHLSEAAETLSTKIQEADRRGEETKSEVETLQETVERQRKQIEELRATVDSLAEILGTATEWQEFGDAADADADTDAGDD
jgi:chromosome segregation ATPase